MQSPTIISFIRHGHVHNPDDIYYGRLPDFRLSNIGQEQARLAGQAMRPYKISAIYSSPMLRAQQTAQLIQTQLEPQPPLYTAEKLIEVYTPHDGISRTELEARQWDLYTGSTAEFEQPADVIERIGEFIQFIREKHVGEHIIAVTHGDNIAFTALWAAGHQPNATRKLERLQHILQEPYPETASILTLTFTNTAANSRPQLAYLNPHSNSSTD